MKTLLALALLALPCAAQTHDIDDGIPSPLDTFAGPVVDDSNPAYWTGPYGPDRFWIPAWPEPDGLSHHYITDVEIVGMRVDRHTQYGVENATDNEVYLVRVGRYVAGKIMYPPELPWIYDGDPIATYTTSQTKHGNTWPPLEPFDGVADGVLSLVGKPGGPSGYWGGGSSDGSPNTYNLFIPWWTLEFFNGELRADGARWVPFYLECKGYWYFYENEGDDWPVPPGHWYWWEDRIGVSIPEHPEGVRYFFDRDGVGPLPEEVVFIPWPEPGEAMTFELGLAPAKSIERLEPDPIGAGDVGTDEPWTREPDMPAPLPFESGLRLTIGHRPRVAAGNR